MRSWPNQYRKNLRRIGLVLLTCVVLVMASWWIFRVTLLEQGWKTAQRKAQRKGYVLQCQSIAFEGVWRIRLKALSLTFAGKPLLQIHEAEATPSLISLAQGKFRLRKLHLNRVKVHLLNKATVCNYQSLLDPVSSSEKPTPSKATESESQRIFHFVSTSLDLLPSDFELSRLNARYSTDTGFWMIQIPELQFRGSQINGSLWMNENGQRSGFALNGSLNRSDITGNLDLKPLGNQQPNLEDRSNGPPLSRVVLPWIMNRWGLSAQMTALHLRVRQFEMNNGTLDFDLEGSIQSLQMMHPKLAADTVKFPRCSGRLRGSATANQLELDSSSRIQIHRLPCRFYGLWARGPQARVDLRIATSKIPANRFLESLPKGMFSHLKGLKANGRLHWFLSLQLEDKQPEQCRFRSALVGDEFRLTHLGESNLAKMNQPFEHIVTQNGVPLRRLWVGQQNPMFTPLNQIPMVMQQAIMTGEDGDFYHHQGFYPEAFRRSIAQNYRKGKFARGGSTISMQLVKNVFLNHRKTIARKAEELLITWIIEKQKITSKARMMEVYLNVIEFGVNVWGIGEASRHYFGKHPSALEPIECVFLAGLVPRPRVFQNLLEADGAVSPRNGNFLAIRNRFVRRGLLPIEDSSRMHVGLRKSAYIHLQPIDSASLARELADEDDLDL